MSEAILGTLSTTVRSRSVVAFPFLQTDPRPCLKSTPAWRTRATVSHRHSTAMSAVAAQDKDLQQARKTKHQAPIQFEGVHHVGFVIEDKERSRSFYCDTLGLSVNEDRPNDKLSFDGLWLWLGPEMLHLMVVPDPDPKTGRPEHGGRDRHVCLGVSDISPVEERLDAGGIEYTKSKSGRRAVFFRDPDMNCLEVFESAPWR